MRELRQLIKQQRSQIHSYFGECVYCGSKTNLTIDHVRPKSRGGSEKTSNLVSACSKCNLNKASNGWESWFRSQPFFDEQRFKRIQEWISSSESQAPLDKI